MLKSAKFESNLNVGALIAQYEGRQLFGGTQGMRQTKEGFVTLLEHPSSLSKKFSDKSSAYSKWFGGMEPVDQEFQDLWIASGQSIYHGGQVLTLKNCIATALICLGVGQAAIGTSDGQVLVMSLDKYERLIYSSPITCLAASNDSLYVGCADGMLLVVKPDFTVQERVDFGISGLTCMSCSPNDGQLAVAARDQLFVFATQDLKVPLIETSSAYGVILCVAWSPDSEMFAYGAQDDQVYIYSNLQFQSKRAGHINFVNGLKWSTNDKLYSVGEDCLLLVWNTPKLDIIDSYMTINLDPIVRQELHQMPITGLLLKEGTLISSDRSGVVCKWKL